VTFVVDPTDQGLRDEQVNGSENGCAIGLCKCPVLEGLCGQMAGHGRSREEGDGRLFYDTGGLAVNANVSASGKGSEACLCRGRCVEAEGGNGNESGQEARRVRLL